MIDCNDRKANHQHRKPRPEASHRENIANGDCVIKKFRHGSRFHLLTTGRPARDAPHQPAEQKPGDQADQEGVEGFGHSLFPLPPGAAHVTLEISMG